MAAKKTVAKQAVTQQTAAKQKVNVLFVCLGNICRSPTAHGVFEAMVRRDSLHETINVDSCGTGDWHLGEAPDKRSQGEALKRGYDLSHLRSRLITPDDFLNFDYVLVMDHSNLANIKPIAPATHQAHVGLFLRFAEGYKEEEVPDPYYGDGGGFTHVLDLVEDASEGLLKHIKLNDFKSDGFKSESLKSAKTEQGGL